MSPPIEVARLRNKVCEQEELSMARMMGLCERNWQLGREISEDCSSTVCELLMSVGDGEVIERLSKLQLMMSELSFLNMI
jgi:hypothetical protein